MITNAIILKDFQTYIGKVIRLSQCNVSIIMQFTRGNIRHLQKPPYIILKGWLCKYELQFFYLHNLPYIAIEAIGLTQQKIFEFINYQRIFKNNIKF